MRIIFLQSIQRTSKSKGSKLGFRVYLWTPTSMQNNCLYGCFYGFQAIILPTFVFR